MENYVGKRIDGRFEILDVVGVGGMAVVYKAYDNIDDRIVAVKILKDEFLANEEFRRRFKNESKAIAVLNHRNIVKVIDVSFGDRLQYIVMEYIEGISLKEYIEQKGVLDWNEALFFSIQILRALQHAHDKGIVHRDVKPQNIMLLENGTIKVTDFGIARFSHSETRTMTEKAIGSVHYMSPEQAKGELTDEKADIYSVGIVLYEMLTGKLPFEAESVVSVALMQVNNEAVLPRTINSNIPLGFEQIVMKAMKKSTRERYQSAAEMLLDLEELKRNPKIKFDYTDYFTDEQPTRYIGKIQDNSNKIKNDVDDAPVRAYKNTDLQDNRRKTGELPVKDDAHANQQVKKPINPKTVAVIAGVGVAVLLFIIILVVNALKNGGINKIEVENFIGMNYEEEIKDNELYEDKYDFEVTYETFTDGKDGCVFKQDPEAGQDASKGVTVRLYVAKSGQGEVIPDFYGQNYQSVTNSLEAMGFVVRVIPDTTTDQPVGSVVRTDPSSGSSVFPGSSVNVYYAAASESGKLFKMPNLSGMSLEEAKSELSKKGLVLSSTEVVDTSADKDRVVAQSPKDGSPVQEGDGVVLTVSSGKTKLSKSITLPKKAGNIIVKATLDGAVISTDTVDSNTNSSYVVEAAGEGESELKVYLNDVLYYEADVNFSRDPARLSGERYHTIFFYPDVLGLNISEAKSILSSAGYKNITVNEQESSEKEGTVLNQSPSQRSAPNLDNTATIVLTVAVPQKVNDANSNVTESDTETQPQVQ